MTDDEDAKRRAARAAYMREYNRRNAERINAQRRARYQTSHPPTPKLTEDQLRVNKAAQDAEYQRRNRDTLSVKAAARYKQNAEEIKAKVRAYAAANPEKAQAYRQANRERRAAQAKAWREANPERVIQYRKARYEANAERLRADSRAYYRAHREERRHYLIAWAKANPGKRQAQWVRKRLRRNPHETVVELIDRQTIYDRDQGICQLCGRSVEPNTMTMDHAIPLSRGGAHTLDNLQLAHHSCNSRKGMRTMDEFRAAQST